MTQKTSFPHFDQIRIENTNYCGYRCLMCPRDKHTRKQGVMSCEDFALVLSRIPPFSGEVHLHGFGEALLDKSLPEKVRLCKKHLPAALVGNYTTLGVPHKESYFFDLIDSGIDALVVSCYGYTQEGYRAVHGRDTFEIVKRNLETIAKIRTLLESPLRLEVIPPGEEMLLSLQTAKESQDTFKTWVESLGFAFAPERRLHNYGDGRSYNRPSDRLCPVVQGMRRSILQITWDLKVIPCCYDYNATISFGSLRENTLQEIFSSPSYQAFVEAHLSGQLDQYPICQNCEKDLY